VPGVAGGGEGANATVVSKAFKGEDASEAPIVVPPRAPLPPGTTNYVTPRGLAALRQESEQLVAERAHLESGDDADQARSLAALGVRIAALEERLATAEVVEPTGQPHDEVRFGARVTVRGEVGPERHYRIVGVDEADAAHGRIAFVAPLARALLGKKVGEAAVVRTPRGDEELEVVEIAYDET
jgi:transcription elongation factor GreB